MPSNPQRFSDAEIARRTFSDWIIGDLVDGCDVEEVQLLAAVAHGGDEIGRFENGEMLTDGLPGHVQARAQLAKVLSTAVLQAVEQLTAARVGQRLEDFVHFGAASADQPQLLMRISPE